MTGHLLGIFNLLACLPGKKCKTQQAIPKIPNC
jgi:hypothetical protein